MRQDSAKGPERGSPSGHRQASTANRETPRDTTSSHQTRPAAHDVFGSFLRTLERLDRDASRQARKTGGAI